MEKLKISKIKCDRKPQEVDKPCQYSGDGCTYKGHTTRLQEHQPICDYRPIECCFKNDGCQNSEIPFLGYIQHLQNVHNVKTFSDEAYVKFYVNRGGKLVRDGSSSMAIIEGPLGIATFILRAIQSEDEVMIWIAIHAHYIRDLRFRNELKLENFGNQSQPLYQSDDYVLSTTWDRYPVSYLKIPVKHLKTNLRQEKSNRGNYVREYWAVTVKIIT
ncbi:uncharacterized protein LOC118436909 [Folsomia candida]|nr:uncharacterized protein LOC118436909 [Folsomia candida]